MPPLEIEALQLRRTTSRAGCRGPATTSSGKPTISASPTQKRGKLLRRSPPAAAAPSGDSDRGDDADQQGDRHEPEAGLGRSAPARSRPRLLRKNSVEQTAGSARTLGSAGSTPSTRTGAAAAAGCCAASRHRRWPAWRRASCSTAAQMPMTKPRIVASTMPIDRDQQRVEQPDEKARAIGVDCSV